MSLPRVLVTDANTTKALAIVRALGPAAEVWTVSPGRYALAAWSRHVKQHVVLRCKTDQDFPLRILELCRVHDIRIVIPPEEPTCVLLSAQRERFSAEKIILATAPPPVLEQVFDKARTLQRARELEIPIPATRVLQHWEEAPCACRELRYPLVIKPRRSHFWDGGRFVPTGGVRYARTEQELRVALASLPRAGPPPLLQEYVPGRGLGISMLLDCGGEVRAAFAHERLRDLRPSGSGSVLRRSIALDPDLQEMSLKLLRHIRWWGVAMVEYRKDDTTGRIHLMEVNGRFWGSLQLAVEAGVNFPRLLVDMLLGKTIPPPAYEQGVIVRWWLGDLVRTLHILRGRPAGFAGSFPSRWLALRELLAAPPAGTRHEVFKRDDPWPAFGEVISLAVRQP